MSQVTEQSVRFQTALASIKLIQASAVLDLTEDDFDFLTSNKVWIATDRSRARRCVEACVYGTLDFVGYPRFPAPVEFIADRKSGSAGMPRPNSYAVYCLKKKKHKAVRYPWFDCAVTRVRPVHTRSVNNVNIQSRFR